jgi:hypothetical protein
MLTVLEPDRELPPVNTPLTLVGAQHDDPADLKAGHVYTLRNHIEVVEDLSFLCGRGARGAPNRKQRREFVWSYGAPDSVGEKREHAETFRGRETVRHDWGHDDDDGDFQHDRRSGNRRHRSLSGWTRSSRCRRGMDDCYSSNDKHRHSTPFRRHGLGMTPSSRWVPKAKVRSVSFSDPIVTVVWPQVESQGLSEDVGGKFGLMDADIQESLHGPSATTCKVTNTVDLANVFTTIHKSLDSVLTCSPSVNLISLNTAILANAPAAQPVEFLIHSSLDSVLEGYPSVNLNNASPTNILTGQQTELLGSQLVSDNQPIDYIMPVADLDGLLGASTTHDPADSDNQEFVSTPPTLGTQNRPAN